MCMLWSCFVSIYRRESQKKKNDDAKRGVNEISAWLKSMAKDIKIKSRNFRSYEQ